MVENTSKCIKHAVFWICFFIQFSSLIIASSAKYAGTVCKSIISQLIYFLDFPVHYEFTENPSYNHNEKKKHHTIPDKLCLMFISYKQYDGLNTQINSLL